MQRQFFSGNSIEQAVMAAARHYKVDPEKLAYRQREKKHGFLNVRKRIVIEVDPNALEVTEEEIVSRQKVVEELPQPVEDFEADAEESYDDEPYEDDDEEDDEDNDEEDNEDNDEEDDEDNKPRHEEERRESRPSRGRQDRDRQDRDRRGGRSKGRDRGRGGRSQGRDRFKPVEVNDFEWLGVDWDDDEWEDEEERILAAYELCLEQILDVMDLDIEYAIESGDTIVVDFEGEDSSVLLEDDGRVLKSVEHILPRMVRSLVDKSVPCNVDCEGFRAGHEEHLKELALKAAKHVVETGRKKVLAPMNPADRRIVHLALVDNEDVETVSEGHGFMKRVKVLPVDDGDYDDDYED